MIQRLKQYWQLLSFHTFWAEKLFAELAASEAGGESQKGVNGFELLCSVCNGH